MAKAAEGPLECFAEVVFDRDSFQAFRLEQGSEDVLEHIHLGAKAFEMLSGSLGAVISAAAFKKPALSALFHLRGRQVGERQKVF